MNFKKSKMSLNYLQGTATNSKINALSKERLAYLKLQNDFEDLKSELETKYLHFSIMIREN